jgi:hypothetical protein
MAATAGAAGCVFCDIVAGRGPEKVRAGNAAG